MRTFALALVAFIAPCEAALHPRIFVRHDAATVGKGPTVSLLRARLKDPAYSRWRVPLTRQGEGLSRKALWVLASTPGVSCVLLGMRHPAYVEDGMGIMSWPPLPEVRPIYEAVQRMRVA